MSKTAEYSGYTIESSPTPVMGSRAWKIRIFISWESKGAGITRGFSPAGMMGTEQEADCEGITFGKEIINGKVEDLALE
ncbi:hypothetical protein W02_20860 [Nitrospira sp. KM1]|uniref:CV_2116 domain-containing protein n=1 Tax=Nitrospira sp. KM1 TaxID=1936990 RepID=UPI0013A75699|nr:hypothetical protein [Nitrospira sp. KM1]BCA54946.1 hypothetical protein W02_20860 [Nitrospira sp. KM1]